MATIPPNTAPHGLPETIANTTGDEHLEMPQFDPAIHLAFEAPSARHSFTELGLPRPKTAPDMCFTEPFQLFSEEGVRMLRRDLLRKEVLDKHMEAWARAPCTISRHEKVHASFSNPNVADLETRQRLGSKQHGLTLPLSNASAKHLDFP